MAENAGNSGILYDLRHPFAAASQALDKAEAASPALRDTLHPIDAINHEIDQWEKTSTLGKTFHAVTHPEETIDELKAEAKKRLANTVSQNPIGKMLLGAAGLDSDGNSTADINSGNPNRAPFGSSFTGMSMLMFFVDMLFNFFEKTATSFGSTQFAGMLTNMQGGIDHLMAPNNNPAAPVPGMAPAPVNA